MTSAWNLLQARMRRALDLACLIGASAGAIAAIVGFSRGASEPALGLVVMLGLALCALVGVVRRVTWTPVAYTVLVLVANVTYLLAFGIWFGLGVAYVLSCTVAFVFFSPRWAWLVAAALVMTPLVIGVLHAIGMLSPNPALDLADRNSWIRASVAAGTALAAIAAITRYAVGQLAFQRRELERAAEQRRAQRIERERVEDELARARRADSIAQLAAEVGADIGAALAVVEARARSLAASLASDDSREALDDIQQATTTAGATMRSLTAFGPDAQRADAGNVAEAVRTLPRLVRRTLPERIALTCRADGDAWVGIGTSELARICANLVFNARDAIAGPGAIEVSVLRDDASVTLEVHDTGSGMSEDTLGRLFQPFFTTKPVGRGTGLGLATTRILVERARGTIAVASALGRGTTFSIRLPIMERG
jgi:signal transduction histidine kinase